MSRCSKCHMACVEQGCKGPGSSACNSCKPGWVQDKDETCSNIDECLRTTSSWPSNQFCVNNEGQVQHISHQKRFAAKHGLVFFN